MIDRIANSWELVKASLRVLQADKELLVYPLVSAISVVLVSLAFVVPSLLAAGFDRWVAGVGIQGQGLGLVVLFLFYLSQYFLILFFNSALVAAAGLRLEGQDPTVADGLRRAFSRIGSIAGYALIAATVGLLLQALSRNRRGLGRLVVSLVGLAWNLATFLVVPVLVQEGVGPLAAIRRSARLLRQTWGEQIAGNLSLSLVFGGLAVVVSLLVLVPVAYLAANLNSVFLLAGLAILVPFYLGLGLIHATLNGIYAAAVYRYATIGDAGDFFEPQLVQAAFRSTGALSQA